MSHLPVYFPVLIDAETTVQELARIFGAAGYVLRGGDDSGSVVASKVPACIAKEPAPA